MSGKPIPLILPTHPKPKPKPKPKQKMTVIAPSTSIYPIPIPKVSKSVEAYIIQEYLELKKFMHEGIKIQELLHSTNPLFITIIGPPLSLYEGEEYELMIIYDDSYPNKPPLIQFVPGKTPPHEHIFHNGHICLSSLYHCGWTTLSKSKEIHVGLLRACIDIIRLLSQSKKKAWPWNDERYCRIAPSDPRMTSFEYGEAASPS
ncbi:putative Ubiquitin-conjugating enzyme [Monocercomonoides exilis]|uniref:putative Ubiquitin-conjugating enzyme n=1 Tax=Monocercomonoides exilis TaxID=2049356 RepID=UPI0035597C07|nr:putative Ubiquitin-conjugating enzyme [Monocercomonoides exilis]|eukprot:MONOS_10408.1-p1 / transcript=MONOS_10408.1 / gene=MONOS_10408 / organism=Monocercomonoides_exilis_PA203 / gene_product=unspecified product / transcript_product=unspecified product / location=Mono_scaffold00473:17221-18006(+) / protein_length=202 / sequence_SO=supercontig / SO=protein_coding / is_pseudo=false